MKFSRLTSIVCLLIPVIILAESISYTCKLNQNEYTFDTLFGKDIVKMSDDLSWSAVNSPGDPLLPSKTISIRVPNNIDVANMLLAISNIKKITLPNKYDIFPLPPITNTNGTIEYWGSNESEKNIINGKNMVVYEKDSLYPNQCIQYMDCIEELERDDKDQLITAQYIRFFYMPFQYNPVQKTLTLTNEITVTFFYNIKAKITMPINLHKQVREYNKFYNIKGQIIRTDLKLGLYISNKFESFIFIK